MPFCLRPSEDADPPEYPRGADEDVKPDEEPDEEPDRYFGDEGEW